MCGLIKHLISIVVFPRTPPRSGSELPQHKTRIVPAAPDGWIRDTFNASPVVERLHGYNTAPFSAVYAKRKRVICFLRAVQFVLFSG